MDLTITVREMTTADVAAVAELEAKAFDDPWSPAAFFEELAAPGRYYSVVEEDGYVAGYGGVMHVEDDAHVMTIAVDPEVAKRRIGTRLMLALVEGAISRGTRNLTLEVRVSNEPALALLLESENGPVGRFVADLAAHTYVRAILNDRTYALPGIPIEQTADGRAPRVDLTMTVFSRAGFNDTAYIDDLIITQNEH